MEIPLVPSLELKSIQSCLQQLAFALPGREKRGDTLMNLCAAFRYIGGQKKTFLISASSKLSQAKSSPDAKVTYFRMVHSATFQAPGDKQPSISLAVHPQKKIQLCPNAMKAPWLYMTNIGDGYCFREWKGFEQKKHLSRSM